MGVSVIPNLSHVTAKEEPLNSEKTLQKNSDKVTLQGTEEKQTAKEIPRNQIKGKNTRYEYNKEIDRVVITISENGTDEVIKEIPPEEVQNMLKRIHTMTGMFMDEEA